jgi:succinate-semialdehyde dehydrogenase/glutarate-semialdehyde dehydrogenase
LDSILGIMPWNFPYWQVMRFVLPTLMSGNAVLVKHASNVTRISIELENIFKQDRFDEGEFISLLIDSSQVASVISDDRIKGVSLTGSNSAGISVGQVAESLIKPMVLELGGSDPFIVTNNCDLEKTVNIALMPDCKTIPESCIAAKRFIIYEDVMESFQHMLIKVLEEMRLGNPSDETIQLGPLATKQGLLDAESQLADAKDKGGMILTTKHALPKKGYFMKPHIVTNIKKDMRIYNEEVFAPVFQLYSVKGKDEAAALANDVEFGLGAACFTESEKEAEFVIDNIESGMVFVNGLTASYPALSFGGVKKSGVSRELSDLGLRAFCNAKTVWIG